MYLKNWLLGNGNFVYMSFNVLTVYDNFAALLQVESHDREKRLLIAKESELQESVQSLQKELGKCDCITPQYMYVQFLQNIQVHCLIHVNHVTCTGALFGFFRGEGVTLCHSRVLMRWSCQHPCCVLLKLKFFQMSSERDIKFYVT